MDWVIVTYFNADYHFTARVLAEVLVLGMRNI